ncbi:MAG: hypothetical protein ACRDWE_08250 [Acidimicrobiales bacterium]
MEFVVDLEKVTAVLLDADDLTTFRVRVAVPSDASPASTETVHRLGDVLRATNVARLEDDGLAWVNPDAARFHAAGQVPEDWDERFERVCGTAATAGGDVEVRAAVLWPTGGAAPPAT